MSRATSAAESSIDWFWQTTQRSAWPISRARASSAGSFSISDGSTASAGSGEQQDREQQDENALHGLPPFEERQDGVAHVLLGDRPAEVEAHDAVAVDQVGLGHAAQAPVEAGAAVEILAGIEEGIAELGEPGARLLGLVLPGDADDDGAVALGERA